MGSNMGTSETFCHGQWNQIFMDYLTANGLTHVIKGIKIRQRVDDSKVDVPAAPDPSVTVGLDIPSSSTQDLNLLILTMQDLC